MEFARRFRELRERAELTKTALAGSTYTVSYLSQIESGRRRPSPGAMAYFAERLGVTPEFLATGIPEGLEESLRYRLEEARRDLREGRFPEAERAARDLAEEAERYGLGRLRAQTQVVLGDTLVPQGRVRESIDKFEAALEDDVLSEREAGMATSALARAYRGVGDLAYALDLVESFLSRGGRGPLDPGVAAELQAVLIAIYFERGDIFRAERAAQRALAAAEQGAPPEVRANVFWDASRIMAEAKRWDDALEYATRARVLMEELDERRSVARLHNNYAFLCLEADPPRPDEAREHLDIAEAWLSEAGATKYLAYVYSERARLALIEDRPDEAIRHAERAVVAAGDDELEAARSLYLRGRALAEMHRTPDARDSLHRAAGLFEKHGARQQQASCWRELGELDLSDGNLEAAVESLRTGLEVLEPRRARA